MFVKICGPNLNDQSKGDFHVHAAGCADLVKHARREPEYQYGWKVDAESRVQVAEEIFCDIMAENEGEWAKPEAYLSDIHFFPCCDDLA